MNGSKISKEKEYNLVRQAKYNEALDLAAQVLNKYPHNPVAQYRFAVLLGDNNEGRSEEQIEKNRKTAAQMLKMKMRPHRSSVSSLASGDA